MEVVHEALRLPNTGGVVWKTKPIRKELDNYFSDILGTSRDGLPLEKILSADIKSLARVIAHVLEVSRFERLNQIHKRFFYTIHMWYE